MIEPWNPSEGISKNQLLEIVLQKLTTLHPISPSTTSVQIPNPGSRIQIKKKGANYESLLSKNHDTLMKAPKAKRICLKRVTCSSSSKSSLSTTCHAIILRAYGRTQGGPATDEGAGLVVDSKM